MNIRRSLLSLSVGMAVGCGGDDDGGVGTAADCAGEYVGTYAGNDSGTLEGTLAEDGAIEVTFISTGSTVGFTGAGQLGSNGRIQLTVAGNDVSGQLNARCQATGTWNHSTGAQGTWQMHLDD